MSQQRRNPRTGSVAARLVAGAGASAQHPGHPGRRQTSGHCQPVAVNSRADVHLEWAYLPAALYADGTQLGP